jgi:uncharacterized protein YvpB
MLLDGLGIDVPYTRLLRMLGIVPTLGAPHSRLQTLRNLIRGIEITYRQGELVNLFQAIDAGIPPAVFVWTDNLPYWPVQSLHALVICGYDDTHFYINDPAFEDAPQVVLHGDLDLAWDEAESYYAVITRKE